MLMGFLASYADSCHRANMSDPATRANVKSILIPKLAAHRRALVEALLWQRKSSRPLSSGVAKDLLLEVAECRKAIRAGQKRMLNASLPVIAQ